MTQDLLELISALREELKHYGEMLALLEHHRATVQTRPPGQTVHATSALQEQAEAIMEARRARELRRLSLARELRQDETATILQLTPLLPPQYRPLVQSLVEENNDLFRSVQRSARENQALLNRSAASMERFLNLLFPASPVAA